MKETRLIMGMPVTIEIVAKENENAKAHAALEKAFDYFTHIDETFSTYKDTSEVSAINAGRIAREEWSPEMELVFTLSEETKQMSGGYFDIKKSDGTHDPSGLVKGWAIWNAAQLLIKEGFRNFYVDAGGDVQVSGVNEEGDPWMVGVKNPWDETENVQAVRAARNEGVATSGTYIRGKHIYDPHTGKPVDVITSLTVIGPNIFEADRFATAAFAMGKNAILFIESIPGFEGYMIDNNKIATKTSNWDNYIQ